MTAISATAMWRIVISPRRHELDAQGHALLRDVHEYGLPHVRRIDTSRLFFLQGRLPSQAVKQIAEHVLSDPITEMFSYRQGGDDKGVLGSQSDAAAEVHLKGGVMDPVAQSTLGVLKDMGAPVDGLEISTGRLYRFQGIQQPEELDFIARKLLSNDCIEDVYLSGFGQHDTRPDHLPVAPQRPFELRHVAIRELDDDALRRLSREGHLFLSLEEMQHIRDYYRRQQRDPTDLELEMFAQTWSEHCVHKTLKSAVKYEGLPMPGTAADSAVVETYDNLLKETVARATHELMESGRVNWCLSVFVDNAGVIAFDETDGIAFKVETHNHPSAIEPYGGAATGIGGCIRDVMGCGLGAKPVANTDIFAVAPPDFPMDLLPKGVLHPRRVLKGIVSGVRDYGNRMGIPTVNGAVVFDDRYLGNPLVFCGCVGLIPNRCIAKDPQPGDLVVVIGGRTGRDGIHGATFSSAELTDTHADEFSHAVQIGNAITEKKVLDAMLRARDHVDGCLYNATTDCGAGGLSSAVGEMAEKLGADVELAKVPLKYAGLRYDEIWISEAQERMVLAVPPGNWETLKSICEAEDVEATAIGAFRDDGQLVIKYDGQVVGELDADFLHNGIPRTQRVAIWTRPETTARPSAQSDDESVATTLLARLGAWNACSKEWIIRQYDHEVQGASVVKPLAGPGEGPSDAAVIRPKLDSMMGVAISNGMAPSLADVDPYWMAVAGIDEAIRNAVCVGADPSRIAILDNFCWGNCDDPATMGALVRACQGCYDAAMAYGTPFISGKDSLNNEFALDATDAAALTGRVPLHNQRIRIPSTLLISAIGIVPDVRQCVTMDAKPLDEPTVFLLVRLEAGDWQDVQLAHAATLHAEVAKLIREGAVLAAHDVGDDGHLVALAEMALAGRCGVSCEAAVDPFAPVVCGYVLQLREADTDRVEQLAVRPGLSVHRVGVSQMEAKFSWAPEHPDSREPCQLTLEALSQAWRGTLAW